MKTVTMKIKAAICEKRSKRGKLILKTRFGKLILDSGDMAIEKSEYVILKRSKLVHLVVKQDTYVFSVNDV